jgi:hypothetical protein
MAQLPPHEESREALPYAALTSLGRRRDHRDGLGQGRHEDTYPGRDASCHGR